MRVAVEAVGNRSGGGLSVLLRTVSALAEDPAISRLDVFCSPGERVCEELPDSSRVVWHPINDHPAMRVAWYERGFATACQKVAADVALCLNGMGNAAIPQVNVVQQALAVHQPWAAVSTTHAIRLRVIRRLLGSSCRIARSVVVQTNWMRSAMSQRFDQESVVLPLGIVPHTGGNRLRSRRLVVGMGGRLPYKNAPVLERIARLAAGGRGVSGFCVFDEPTRPFHEVRAALESAAVTVVPSRLESFGLPLVEAFAFGSAVLAADRPYSRDVCDNAALYFTPDDPVEAWSRLSELLSDEALRGDLVQRGQERLEAMWKARPYERLVEMLEAAA